ncbi:DUF4376 domain-containing protein [Pseudooceanicola nanhaiensis]|uniref:DUF4376 domain-containing protein n=1 Tax=Pseudooceanicola nanhaiensis TaxID=375761 RepID=UPI00351560D1
MEKLYPHHAGEAVLEHFYASREDNTTRWPMAYLKFALSMAENESTIDNRIVAMAANAYALLDEFERADFETRYEVPTVVRQSMAVSIDWPEMLDIDDFPEVIEPGGEAAAAFKRARIDEERDRRIAKGFVFADKLFQARPQDRENISGASIAALAAMVNGAQAGDLTWHGDDDDFAWIVADNSLVPMDAQTMFAFGQTCMKHVQDHIFAARAMKDADPIPADFNDDAHWPGAVA